MNMLPDSMKVMEKKTGSLSTGKGSEEQRMLPRKNRYSSILITILTYILKTNNIQPVICLQPMLALRMSSMYSIQEKSFDQDSLLNKHIQVLYPTVLKELTDLTGRYQVPFINMVIPFNDPAYKGKQLFIDYCHLSPLGAEVVADNLLQAVDSVWVKSFPGGQ